MGKRKQDCSRAVLDLEKVSRGLGGWEVFSAQKSRQEKPTSGQKMLLSRLRSERGPGSVGKSVAPKPCPQPAKGHGTESKMETSGFVIYVYDEGRSLYISRIPIPDPFTSVCPPVLGFSVVSERRV